METLAFLSLIVAQAIYTSADTWRKMIFGDAGFGLKVLTSPVFIATVAITVIGFLFQMYALSKIELSRTIITLGILAVVFSAAAGVFFLGERLQWWNWVGVALAAGAIVLVNVR